MAGWGGRGRRFSQSNLSAPIVVFAKPLVQGPQGVQLAWERSVRSAGRYPLPGWSGSYTEADSATTPALDFFQRTQNPLRSGWTTPIYNGDTDMQANGTAAQGTTPGANSNDAYGTTYGSEQEAWCTFSNSNAGVFLYTRISTPNTVTMAGFELELNFPATIFVRELQAGNTNQVLISGLVVPAFTNALAAKLRVTGGALPKVEALIDYGGGFRVVGSYQYPVGSPPPANLQAGGLIGMGIFDSSSARTINSFGGGNITVAPYPLTKRNLGPHPPQVIAAASPVLRDIQVTTFVAAGAPHSPALARTMILGPPVVLNVPPAVEIYGPETTLAYSVRGKAKPHLFPPIIPPPVVALAPPIEVRLARSLRGIPKSDLRAPVVVAPILARPTLVHLAYSLRGRPKPRLAPPTVVAPVLAPPVQTSLAYSRRGAPKSRLAAPTVVGPVLARPTLTHLAYSLRGRPLSTLREPVVVSPVLARPIAVTFARIRPPSRLCRLGAPVVLFAATTTLAAPVQVHLARSLRGAPKSRLFAPAVVTTTTPTFGPPLVRLARIRPVAVHSILRAPTVVAPVLARPILVHLAYSLRGRPLSILREPIVVAPVLAPPLATSLAYSRRGAPRSRLAPPTVVGPVVVLREAIVHLAYSLRGKAKPRLAPPAIVGPVLAPPIATTFARITPPAVHSILRRPTDTIGLEDQGQDRIHLAYSRRGVPKSRLSAPTVVAPVLARAILVHLAYSLRGRPKPRLAPPAVVSPVLARPIDITLVRIRPVATRSVLRRPTDLVDQQDLGFVAVTLAYSLRGRPLSTLREPAVVGPVLARPILVHLAYSLRGTPKSILREPVVVSPVLASPIKVALARITPPRTHSILRPPTDTSGLEDEGTIAVTLAYSLRGQPKSELRPPTVVAPVLARPILVHLARITPPPTHPILREPVVIDLRPQVYSLTTWLTYSRRGKPKSFLRPESKFAPQPQADYTLLVHLAYSSRGKPKPRLAPPAVVRAATPYLRPIDTTLAYSSRGKAKPRLSRPIVVGIFTARPTKVTLAPSRFPRPKSRLRPPTVVAPVLAAPIAITLAPQKRGIPKSILRAPAVIFVPQADSTLLIHLAYSRRGTPKSRLSAPVATPPLVSTLLVSLAPQSRGKPKPRLAPPTVVAIAQADSTLLVHLAYSSRGVARSILRKPAVVGGGIAFTGPTVTLVRIRPPRTIWRLPQAAYPIVVCYGTVVGFDFAPEVCGDDDGATVIGSMESAEVCGDDSGATATGASAPGGSVSGGDAQREGC